MRYAAMCVSGAGNKSVVEGGGDIAAVLNRNTSLVNLDLNCEAMAGVCEFLLFNPDNAAATVVPKLRSQ